MPKTRRILFPLSEETAPEFDKALQRVEASKADPKRNGRVVDIQKGSLAGEPAGVIVMEEDDPI